VSSNNALLDSAAREKALGLRELRYFLSAALTGNLGRAARALNVSPAVISQQLRKLEKGLGTQLLLRHGRGVTPTLAGACLRDRVHTIMRLLAAPLDEAGAETLPGTITLGVAADTGGPLVVPLFRSFRLRWPEVTLNVREGLGADLAEWIVQRSVDVAILEDPPLLPEVEVIPIMTETLGLVAPVQSLVAQDSRPLSVRELIGQPLILPSTSHWLRRRLDKAAIQRGVHLVPILQVDSARLSKVMVRGGFGYTILPYTAVQTEVTQGNLAFRPIIQPSLICNRSIAFHRAASNTLIAAFADMARETTIALAHSGVWQGIQILT
jgi:LysR family transcriptional regulator, nitrogen assimilation regulatory protein